MAISSFMLRSKSASSDVLSLGKFAGLPAAFTQSTMGFGCEAVFSSTVEAEKIR